MKVRFLAPAQADLADAIAYYENQRLGLGLEFAQEVTRTLERILQYPEAWAALSQRTRRCRTRRFPYGVVYRAQQDTVLIVAVMHLGRGPGSWEDRLRDEQVECPGGQMRGALETRRYRAGDHDAVWAVHNLALSQVGAHVGSGPWDDDLHHVEEVYLGSGGEFLVGECDGQVVAMGALRRVSDTEAKVTRMRVHPDCQRRGFGQAILERLEARARELGYTRLTLETTVQQVAAQRLYEKNGYAETGRTRMHGFDVILYAKRMSAADGRGEE